MYVYILLNGVQKVVAMVLYYVLYCIYYYEREGVRVGIALPYLTLVFYEVKLFLQ